MPKPLVLAVLPFTLVLASACGSSAPPVAVPVDGSADAPAEADAACTLPALSSDAGAELALPAPTGAFGVARGQRRTVVDPIRDELETADPNDHRAVAFEVYYPTVPCPSGSAAVYLDDAEGKTLPLVPGDWWKRMRTFAVAGAPMVADGKKHPVLLFSPGYAALPRFYTSYLVELASHGYIVVAVSHPYWTPATTFADGSTVKGKHDPNTLDATTANLEAVTWLDDQRLVLDELTKLADSDAAGELTGRLDLAHVGAFGHSFGGATAVNLLAHDPRVMGGANLDGTIYGPDDAAGGTAVAKPMMLFLSARSDLTFSAYFGQATSAAWMLTLSKAGHFDFSDLGIVFDSLGQARPKSLFGTIDPTRALRVVNDYLLAFFDQSLVGATKPLLDGPSADYAEVTMKKKP